MSFDIVFNYILKRTGVDYGAGQDGFARLLQRLGNPQEQFKIVHVAGTNGKGSVATMTARALECAGYKTGLFVSPHLISPAERIQINGTPISKKSFSQVIVDVFQEEEDELNFFEILTAAALVYFARKKVDYAVLETGLGGRKDPTNACTAALSIITAVGLDHTQYLGSSLAQIAREKAGIIKAGVPVISGAMNPTVREIIAKTAKVQNAPLTFVGQGEPFWESSVDIPSGRTLMRTDDGSVWPLYALGARQVLNACVVYQAAKTLGLPARAVKKAFETVELAGRFEIFHSKTALSEDAVLLCGFMKDKDYKKMLALLRPYFKTVIVTVPPSARGAGEEEIRAALAKNAQIVFEPDWKKALGLALSHEKTLCTGSFYLVGAVRAKLENRAFKRV